MGEQELINELQNTLSEMLEKIGEQYPNHTSTEYIVRYLDTLVASCNFWSQANNGRRIIYDIDNAIAHFSSCFPVNDF